MMYLVLGAACGATGPRGDPPAQAAQPGHPMGSSTREIVDTRLALDLATQTGTASIAFGASSVPGATLEVGDLAVAAVRLDGAALAYTDRRPAIARIDLALAPANRPITVEIDYRWRDHDDLRGASPDGFTVVWPYWCGNLFPCHSQPADGSTFTLALANVPRGKTAVFPAAIPVEAPAYQLAWSIDDYSELALGTTTAGTRLSVWHRPGEHDAAVRGSEHLLAAFQWLERTIGPYRFGRRAGSVSVKWGADGFGGMEHHPFWHVGSASIGDVNTHVHEAAHGWFGNGVRLRCWEDFVLSEGTASYLAGRALDVVAPRESAAIWAGHEEALAALDPATKVWPASCGAVDILKDALFTSAPYVRGALFYRAVALRVGAARLDTALAAFYAAHAGRAATMTDMLDAIRKATGFDPVGCAETWLRSTSRPVIGPCR
jgi:aminopeptidase N